MGNDCCSSCRGEGDVETKEMIGMLNQTRGKPEDVQ